MAKTDIPSIEIQNERAEIAYKFYRGKGATHQGACALTASIKCESAFNPDALNVSEDARGLFQWRNERIFPDSMIGDFDAQLEYSWEELVGKNGNPRNSKTGKGKKGTIPLREALTDDNVTSSQIHSSLEQSIRWGDEGGRYNHAKAFETKFRELGKNNAGFGDNIFTTLKTEASNAVDTIKEEAPKVIDTIKDAATNDKGNPNIFAMLGLGGAGMAAVSDKDSGWKTLGIVGVVIGLIGMFLNFFMGKNSDGQGTTPDASNTMQASTDKNTVDIVLSEEQYKNLNSIKNSNISLDESGAKPVAHNASQNQEKSSISIH